MMMVMMMMIIKRRLVDDHPYDVEVAYRNDEEMKR